MDIAKICENDRSQDEILTTKYEDIAWNTFLNGMHSFTDDFMDNGRAEEILSTRETL